LRNVSQENRDKEGEKYFSDCLPTPLVGRCQKCRFGNAGVNNRSVFLSRTQSEIRAPISFLANFRMLIPAKNNEFSGPSADQNTPENQITES
jgi:hypothetical protein